MNKFLYYSLQWTWGIIMNIVGLLVFLILVTKPHDIYKNSIRTKINADFGFSIGMFIFVPNDNLSNHEYGHTIQNIIYGVFDLFIVCIPSLIWYWTCKIKNDFSNYYYKFPENQATKLGQIF